MARRSTVLHFEITILGSEGYVVRPACRATPGPTITRRDLGLTRTARWQDVTCKSCRQTVAYHGARSGAIQV